MNKRTISYALAGVGAVALGSFAFFAVTGKSDENDLRDRCSPNCPESDVDSVRTKYLVADISLGVGIASLGAATFLFVTSNDSRKAKPPYVTAIRVAVRPCRRRFHRSHRPSDRRKHFIGSPMRCILAWPATHSSQVGATHRNSPGGG